MKARLILEDGTVFKGKAFGYLEESVGEVVFNTSMTGYGEVLTDPSYYGQIVTMTYPLIGNYGINLEDVQSRNVCVKGFIVREKSDTPNNFRNEMSLDVYLKQNKIIGLEGIDTRALTKILRNNGTHKEKISGNCCVFRCFYWNCYNLDSPKTKPAKIDSGHMEIGGRSGFRRQRAFILRKRSFQKQGRSDI